MTIFTCKHCGEEVRKKRSKYITFCSIACSNKARHPGATIRFWKNVEKTETCWLWTAGTRQGYGQLSVGGGVIVDAHRLSYELAYGKIQDGLCVLHKCDVRLCVNPSHLMLGTKADNMHDMRDKGRGARGSKNARSKLTAEQVMEIRRLRGTVRADEIARKFNISDDYVYQLCNRDRWGWL